MKHILGIIGFVCVLAFNSQPMLAGGQMPELSNPYESKRYLKRH